MVTRLANHWKWLQPSLWVLMVIAIFASLPEPLDKILFLVAFVPLGIYVASDLLGVFRREHAEYQADLAERERSNDHPER